MSTNWNANREIPEESKSIRSESDDNSSRSLQGSHHGSFLIEFDAEAGVYTNRSSGVGTGRTTSIDCMAELQSVRASLQEQDSQDGGRNEKIPRATSPYENSGLSGVPKVPRMNEKYARTYGLERYKKNAMIIFNHIHFLRGKILRESTMEDEATLRATFEMFKFEVKSHLDLEKKLLLRELKTFCSKDFSEYGCVCVAILTHGSKHGYLNAYDTRYSEHEIIECFDVQKNPTLFGKPIIILIQACRGSEPAIVWSPESRTTERHIEIDSDGHYELPTRSDIPTSTLACRGSESAKVWSPESWTTERHIEIDSSDHYELPIRSDMLIFHSSYVGCVSFRHVRNGSWFIQTLCDEIKLLAATEDFESICRAVRRKVALDKAHKMIWNSQAVVAKQMPVVTCTLLRHLYLPTYVEDKIEKPFTLEKRADSLGAAADTSREFDLGLARLRDALQTIGNKLDDLTMDNEPEEQLRKIENLERQLEGQRPLLADLEAAGALLADPAAHQDIQAKLAAVGRQYDALQRRLDHRKAEIEAALKEGRNLEENIARTLGWLQSELGALPGKLLVSADKHKLQLQLERHEPLHRELTQREHELIMLLVKGREMEKKPAHQGLRKELDRVQTQWDKLKLEIVDRHTRLQTAMEHCRKYSKAPESFLPWMSEAQERLSKLPPAAFTKREVEKQLRELQAIRNDIWKRSGEYENNKTLGETFISACDADQEIVRGQLDTMKQRWDRLNNEVLQQVEFLESTARKLGDFAEKVRAVETSLQRCEECLQDALGAPLAAATEVFARVVDTVHALRAPLQSINSAVDDIVTLADECCGSDAGLRARHVLDATAGALAERLDELETRAGDARDRLADAASAMTHFQVKLKRGNMETTVNNFNKITDQTIMVDLNENQFAPSPPSVPARTRFSSTLISGPTLGLLSGARPFYEKKHENFISKYDDKNVPHLPSKYATTYELEKFSKNAMIIFNHELFLYKSTRSGTKKDEENLRQVFESYRFEVNIHRDLTKQNVIETIRKFAQTDFSECGCICVVILTHGVKKTGYLMAYDRKYSESEIFKPFDASRNHSLVAKPIIFIIQACRGEETSIRLNTKKETGLQVDGAEDRGGYNLPKETDMIVFRSSVKGRASVRHPDYGTWFIQALCEKIKEFGQTHDLETIFRMARQKVALHDDEVVDWKQMPIVTTTTIRAIKLARTVQHDEDQPQPAAADAFESEMDNTQLSEKVEKHVPLGVTD